MSKQINIDDLIPSGLKVLGRKFLDEEYMARNADRTLPAIRTRYEAYGKMCECMVNVSSTMDSLKGGMRDCLNALTGMDATYRQSAEAVYNELLDVFLATAEMSVQTLNCIYQIESLTPLEAMAENIDDEGSENTDPVDDDELPEGEEDGDNE